MEEEKTKRKNQCPISRQNTWIFHQIHNQNHYSGRLIGLVSNQHKKSKNNALELSEITKFDKRFSLTVSGGDNRQKMADRGRSVSRLPQ